MVLPPDDIEPDDEGNEDIQYCKQFSRNLWLGGCDLEEVIDALTEGNYDNNDIDAAIVAWNEISSIHFESVDIGTKFDKREE